MTTRQKLLKFIYPLFIRFQKVFKGKDGTRHNVRQVKPNSSFYELKAVLPDGTNFNFSTLRGRKVLIVNIASDCGYTPQYDELEKLYQSHERLVVLGFPSNDFKGQEPGSDKEIDDFCRMNYAISFPLFQKNSVLLHEQQEVFQWLTNIKHNGWNDQPPTWNFCKYLVDESGNLQSFFPSYVSPLSNDMKTALK